MAAPYTVAAVVVVVPFALTTCAGPRLAFVV
jgi:hypothetical protein